MKVHAISMRSSRRPLFVAGLVGAMVFWVVFSFSTSADETRFGQALKSEKLRDAKELKLSELMPGEWELVCGSNGYSGEFYLKQYDRTYPAVGAPQDGSWGLVFIARDGSYKSAAGNCASPGIYLEVESCTKRAHAVLSRKGTSQKACLHFARNDA